MKSAMIKVENNDVLKSLRSFLAELLDSGFVSALLVPKMLPGGDGFVQTLIKKSDMLSDVNPLAPTMPVQSARILSDLAGDDSAGKIGAVLKPCELRASIELAKFLQVNLENVVTIGVDCNGTYEVKDYADMADEDRDSSAKALIEGKANGTVRECCSICEYPAPINADITIGMLGCNTAEELAVMLSGRLEDELQKSLSLDFGDAEPAGRGDAIEKLVGQRKEARERILGDLKGRTDSMEKLMGVFSSCIRCHNCMNVCPICYCRECTFQSPVFEHKADQLLKLADRKGAIRMPGDTLIFHLTRMNHMGTSCVGCGMCDSACPNQLPVSSLFGSIGGELQEMFEYVPGRNPEEEPPVSVFKEDELQDETGAD